MKFFAKLKPLVMMQLKDKIDLSFVKNKRSLIIKTAVTVLKFVLIVACFYLLFFVCNLLSIFRPAGRIPDTVVNVIFVIIQLLSLITCTAGLVNVLYMTSDNKVLLTMPASPTLVYVSKLLVYFIFELKRNLTFTLPVFLAYGIISGAVWYYYPWILVCFVFISLLPVCFGAILSIPAYYIMNFIKSFKWLQFILIILSGALACFGLVTLINKIPANINIMGQWGTIFLGIQNFLLDFSKTFSLFYYLTTMMVGGTLRISSQLFGKDTFIIFGVFLLCITLALSISFVIAKPLFVKMASRQFEFEKTTVDKKPNKLHKKFLSPYYESLAISVRSTKVIIITIIQLALPAIAILLLNKIYAAMNTNFTGQLMTKTFNFLVMLILLTAFNNEYATLFSREASARNLIKVRPISPIHILFGRLSLRIVTIVLSVVGVVVAYSVVSKTSLREIIFMGIITMLLALSHLLWAAELDVMHSYADQYSMVGLQFDSPNERTATIIGFLLSILFTIVFYFISDRGSWHAVKTLFVIALAFTVYRVYMFITRTKLYFVEN